MVTLTLKVGNNEEAEYEARVAAVDKDCREVHLATVVRNREMLIVI